MGRSRVDIGDWIDAKAGHPVEHRRRQVVDVLIKAIANAAVLRDALFLKGGALMNLVYRSPRMTTDVDFTTVAPRDGFERCIADTLDREMSLAALDLGYTHLLFRIQNTEMRPPQPDFPWPTLRLNIGFAERGGPQERRLSIGQAAHVLHVDISFNEPVFDWQEVEIHSDGGNDGTSGTGDENTGAVILAYSVHELVAEKLRAIIQQNLRNRYRRQDIYDVARILSICIFDDGERRRIFEIFLAKSRSRDIEPTRGMIDEPELYERSREQYDDMAFDHMGGRLDFHADFTVVAAFYRSLPWSGE